MKLIDYHHNFTIEQYLDLPYPSMSKLYQLEDCPVKFGLEADQTAAMTFGSFYHVWLLEPGSIDDHYMFVDPLPRRGTAKRKELEASGKTLISTAELSAAMGMGQALNRHRIARSYIETIQFTEKTITYEYDGIGLKARLDGISRAESTIIDLKTTRKADAHSFKNSFEAYGYGFQAVGHQWAYEACAQAGLMPDGIDRYVLIAQEKIAPYAIGIYEVCPSTMRNYRVRAAKALEKYRKIFTSDDGYLPHYNDDRIECL